MVHHVRCTYLGLETWFERPSVQVELRPDQWQSKLSCFLIQLCNKTLEVQLLGCKALLEGAEFSQESFAGKELQLQTVVAELNQKEADFKMFATDLAATQLALKEAQTKAQVCPSHTSACCNPIPAEADPYITRSLEQTWPKMTDWLMPC